MLNTHLLSQAMGFPFKIPKHPITRSIRSLFAERIARDPEYEIKRYQPKQRIAKPKNALSDTETKILNLVNKHKEVTGLSIASATGWTQNHCSMILTSLWRKSLVRRRKEKGNHTRWYVYSKKEGV